MSGKEKADPDFADASSWELSHHSAVDNSPYFFDTDDYKENSILSEFGWDIPPESSGECNRGDGFAVLPPIEPDLVESRAVLEDSDLIGSSVEPIVEAASPSNPSISSSSSGDQPDKSTASGISSSADANPSPEPAGKTKKKAQKRIRQPRFAFVTKSEVDHLEDGYRWRKYGQKAVKNSQFPRSYYRCTNSKCMVKKRIERSSEDPTVVITTYEGQHCHHSVGYPTPNNSHLLYHPPPPNSLRPPRVRAGGGGGGGPHTTTLQTQPPDEGLLGDIVPPTMRNSG